MHVKAKQVSLLGILLAVATLMILAASVLRFNTLFFLGLASFLLGVAVRETNLRMGAAYSVAALLLAFFFMPDKFECFTYGAFLGYIFMVECIKKKKKPVTRTVFLVIKLLFFNICYLIPLLVWFPGLLIQGFEEKLNPVLYILLFLAGQGVLLVFDYVYDRFIEQYWFEFRKKLKF